MTSVKEVEFRTEESKKNLEMAMKAANMASWVYDVNKKVFNPLYGLTVAKKYANGGGTGYFASPRSSSVNPALLSIDRK